MSDTSPEPERAVSAFFTRRNLPFQRVEHPPTATVAAGEAVRAAWPGSHTKSLFVVDKSGGQYLLTVRGSIRVDLKAAGAALGADGRLSFGGEAEMVATLGVRPGSVTPLALINDRARRIRGVVLDRALAAAEKIWCHPLRNTASVALRPADLVAFVTAHHGPPIFAEIERPS